MSTGEVSRLLEAYRNGDPEALQRLVPLFYAELRRIAAYYLKAERVGHTLQPTALVHEAYLRLAEQQGGGWESRAHLFAAAARVMRHVLVDHARARRAGKRGGGGEAVFLDDLVDEIASRDGDLVALDDALAALLEVDERQARVVEMRFFIGLSVEETAEALGVSPITVKRDWATAKLWLRRELGRGRSGRPET